MLVGVIVCLLLVSFYLTGCNKEIDDDDFYKE